MELAMRIDDVCDYIIARCAEAGVGLNLLKLQKLLYYVQAWHLAFFGTPLFGGKFQAWVHGPVNREVYDRFKDEKSLYSAVTVDDVREGFDGSTLSDEARRHINKILNTYGAFTGDQLEEMTHSEDPWIRARDGYRPTQRCEVLIDENVMSDYYRARLQ